MIKNVSKVIMLLAVLAFLLSSCNSFRQIDYHPPSYKGESTVDKYKQTNSGKYSAEKRLRKNITQYAKKYVGVRYKYAGKNPKGFDCSGFCIEILKSTGLLPRKGDWTAQNLWDEFKDKEVAKPYTGCLVFWNNKRKDRIIHVEFAILDRAIVNIDAHNLADNHKGIGRIAVDVFQLNFLNKLAFK